MAYIDVYYVEFQMNASPGVNADTLKEKCSGSGFEFLT